MEEVAYQLEWDVDHFEKYDIEEQDDLTFIEFGGYDKFAIYQTASFPVPNPLVFSGYPPIVKGIDFPYTDNRWTVISPRMYEVLLSVGNFSHRALPTVAIDCQVPLNKRLKLEGKPRPEIIINEFITIHLTEHLPIFDFENSVFSRPSKNLPDLLDVEEYVFQIPAVGLPPLFRLSVNPISLFISHEARMRLKAEEICGTRYISLKGFSESGNDEVDVEVSLSLLESN